MFARLVEATSKPGKKTEVINILTNDLQPLLKKQQGFVDAVGLTGDVTPEEGATLTFWATKSDAERFYGTPEFMAIMGRIKPLLKEMNIHTFNVETSTFHKSAAGRAA